MKVAEKHGLTVSGFINKVIEKAQEEGGFEPVLPEVRLLVQINRAQLRRKVFSFPCDSRIQRRAS